MSGYLGPVRQDMQVRTRADIRPKVLLKQDRYDAMTRVLGLTTDPARAKFFGYTDRTIRRARAGQQIGEDFIARTVTGFRAYEAQLVAAGFAPAFDELFVIELVA